MAEEGEKKMAEGGGDVSVAVDLVVSAFKEASLGAESKKGRKGAGEKGVDPDPIDLAFSAFEAATSRETGHLKKLRRFLKALSRYKLHKIVDHKGKSLLHWAAIAGDITTVSFLIMEKNMSVRLKDFEGDTPLFHAICSNNVNVMHFLIERGSELNEIGSNLLIPAVNKGDVELMTYLVNQGVNVNAVYPVSALQLASRRGDRKMVKALLDQGASVNTGRGGSKTPIMEALSSYAIRENTSLSCINTIFVKNANADQGVFDFDRSPLCYISAMKPFDKKIEIMQSLIKNKADPTRADMLGLTPLEGASLVKDFESAVYLVKERNIFTGVDEWNLQKVRDYVNAKNEETDEIKRQLIKTIKDNGDKCISNQEFYSASAWFDLACEILERTDEHILSSASFCFAKINMPYTALALANDCKSQYPMWPTSYIRVAEAYRIQHRFSKADQIILEGLKLLPDNEELLEALKYVEKNDEKEWLFIPDTPRYKDLVKTKGVQV